MGTKVYGASDDLVEFEGDVRGEVGCYGTDDKEQGTLLVFSDGTILEVKYGKLNAALWGITLHVRGLHFLNIEVCIKEDEDSARYSDIAYFKDGLKWAYAAKEWGKVS